MKLLVLSLFLCGAISIGLAHGKSESCESYYCQVFACYECPDGECIPWERQCNGYDDCNGSWDDEHLDDPDQCPRCNGGQFRCDNGRCITDYFQCDGRDNCGDMSDEHVGKPDDCPACRTDAIYYRCKNGRCKHLVFMCDGRDDCGDNSDEFDEETGGCPACPQPDLTFTCDNGKCIDKKWVCDGANDCEDGSDERACSGTRKNGVKNIFGKPSAKLWQKG